MTIPIIPGPFNFLAELGKAGGNVFAAHERYRQQKVEESAKLLDWALKARKDNYLPPGWFHSPQAQEAYTWLHLGPDAISDQPTSGEQISGAKDQAVLDFIRSHAGAPAGSNMAEEANQFYNLPSGATGPKVQAEKATAQATVPKAAVEQATAEAQLPQAGVAGLAEQGAKQTTDINKVATNLVGNLYNQNKKLPTPEEALAYAQSDPTFRPFASVLTRTTLGDAIEQQRRELYKEMIQAQLAQAAMMHAVQGDVTKLKAIPPSVVKNLTDNQMAVSTIGDAITSIESNPNAKKAIGHWWNLLPDFVVERLNKAGAEVRADIANVGSIVFRDRSGVAVTVSEAKRLKPFVPKADDPPDVAVKKLKNLRDYIQGESEAYGNYYTPENGFHPYRGASSGPGTQTETSNKSLDQWAEDAIKAGADPTAVKSRLQELKSKRAAK